MDDSDPDGLAKVQYTPEERPLDPSIPHNTPKDDIEHNEIPGLSSFDIFVYAYLKEALINTRESPQVKHLQSKKNLMWFVEYIDALVDGKHLESSPKNKITKVITETPTL